MAARRPSYPVGEFERARPGSSVMERAELLLLLVAVGALLFVAGIWLRNAVVGRAPCAMAAITVEPGDTLWRLAVEYGDPNEYILERVNALARANGLGKSRMLREGQTLVIPVSGKSAKLYNGGRYASTKIAD
ncbi:MAG TPA: LysM peptidoglycan-binding domain-containing protein [Armatimonadota bacterium]|nr:LysM peptidoglycan-binding domain-containing protein [Armatimonadota bacterium]